EIYKSMKEEELKQPNPEVSTCTNPNSQWIIPMPLLDKLFIIFYCPDSSRLTKDVIKNELNQRGIQYNEEKLKVQQVASTSNFIEKNIITIPEIQESTNKQMLSLGKENQLEIRYWLDSVGIRWALKEMQEYGKRGGRKHMTARIIELLKSFFHTGDIDKSERYTAKDMLDSLEKKAEVGELEISEVPKLKTIENWIGRYARQYKK
ncbi:6346_t:CDS:2, partial [Gigaspora rosea]